MQPTMDRMWAMRMTWHDLLFAHWPVMAAVLRPHVPAGLEIETHNGAAWIGVVPFHMRGIRMRNCPAVPTTGAFAELNVRTYVTDGRKRGVWFFSLDAESRLAVFTARRFWHLNYRWATMRWRRDGEAIDYESSRKDGTAEFAARYWPTGEAFESRAGTLEEFLTERYWMFAADRHGRLYRGEVVHERWTLRGAAAEIRRNTMARAMGVELPQVKPHLLYGKCGEVFARKLQRVT